MSKFQVGDVVFRDQDCRGGMWPEEVDCARVTGFSDGWPKLADGHGRSLSWDPSPDSGWDPQFFRAATVDEENAFIPHQTMDQYKAQEYAETDGPKQDAAQDFVVGDYVRRFQNKHIMAERGIDPDQAFIVKAVYRDRYEIGLQTLSGEYVKPVGNLAGWLMASFVKTDPLTVTVEQSALAQEPERGQGVNEGPSKPTNPKDAIGIRKAPMSTVSAPVMAEVGVAMLEGSAKYGRHNYRYAGVRASVYYDATMRHLMQWWEGEDVDEDSGLSHVTKAISALVVMRDTMIQGKFTDDRPPKSKAFMADLNRLSDEILTRHSDKDPEHFTEVEHGAAKCCGASAVCRTCPDVVFPACPSCDDPQTCKTFGHCMNSGSSPDDGGEENF